MKIFGIGTDIVNIKRMEKSLKRYGNKFKNNIFEENYHGKIIDPDGNFQLSSRRAYPGILTSIFQITGLSYLFPNSKIFGKYNYTYIPHNKTHEVDSISGACMIFRRELFDDLNGFDEDYFLFFEETTRFRQQV